MMPNEQITSTNSIVRNGRFQRVTQNIIQLLPWLWLGLIAVLVAGSVQQTGNWPTYGQPDPKQMNAFSLLVKPAIFLLMLTLASIPFGLIFTVFATWQKSLIAANKKHTWLYLLGVSLFLVVVVGDLAGLMTWLVD
jgi:hypothetical protein